MDSIPADLADATADRGLLRRRRHRDSGRPAPRAPRGRRAVVCRRARGRDAETRHAGHAPARTSPPRARSPSASRRARRKNLRENVELVYFIYARRYAAPAKTRSGLARRRSRTDSAAITLSRRNAAQLHNSRARAARERTYHQHIINSKTSGCRIIDSRARRSPRARLRWDDGRP